MNQREGLFECETENTHEPCNQTNIFVLDKERGCDWDCSHPFYVNIVSKSLVVGWGWSLAITFLSRLKMLLVNDTEDTKSLLSYRLPSCRAPRKLWLQSLCLHSHQQVRIYIRLFWPLKYWTFFRMGLQHSFKRRKLNSQNRSIQQNGEFEYREGWGGRDWIVNEYKCDQFFPLLSLLFEEWWYHLIGKWLQKSWKMESEKAKQQGMDIDNRRGVEEDPVLYEEESDW